ncbi:hypothetical protein ACIRP7_40080 [Streptomyces sp. NPDC102270]|uniref:hypothetical protein n=1 Tax=Streptomyces sp. NPDC102270 TaxID=3366150 RepID=UPI00380AE9DD
MRSEKSPGYAAARLYYPVSPARAGDPEALTRSKADALRACVGADLELRVETTPFSPELFGVSSRGPCAEAVLRLVEAEWSDHVLPQVRGMDGSLFLRFRLDDSEFLQQLIDHRDPDWDPELAFRRRILHWGTQNWGGLTWTLSAGGTHLYCCDVDVFLPEEPQEVIKDLYLYVLSFDPVAYACARSDEAGEAQRGRGGLDQSVVPDRADRPADPPGDPGTAAPAEDPRIGRCVDCGTWLTLPSSMLAVLDGPGGTAVVPCTGCGKGRLVRISSASDRRLGGVRYEMLPPPDPSLIPKEVLRAIQQVED